MSTELERKLLASEGHVPTGRLDRMLRMGTTALRVGASLVGRGPSQAQSEMVASALGELKGLAMKAGQMLSYVDPSVPAELSQALKALQQSAQAAPFSEIEAQVRASLGGAAEGLLARLEREPVSVASIGQVHRGRLPDGTAVAVKVRHPGIEQALAADFRTASGSIGIASFLLPKGVTVLGFVEEARSVLLSECDYQREAASQKRFAELFADDPDIEIPRVFDEFSGDGVLTTSWLEGLRFDDFRASENAAARDRAGQALFRFHVGALYQHDLFHADPHPGNYAFREDGRVVVYDFGCVRVLPPAVVDALARCADAIRRDDLPSAFAALAAVGALPPTDRDEQLVMRELLRGFFSPLLTAGRRRFDVGAFGGARDLLADKRRLMRLALPPAMLFLFRLRFGLFSVLHQLGATADWAALERGWAERRTESGRHGLLSRRCEPSPSVAP